MFTYLVSHELTTHYDQIDLNKKSKVDIKCPELVYIGILAYDISFYLGSNLVALDKTLIL